MKKLIEDINRIRMTEAKKGKWDDLDREELIEMLEGIDKRIYQINAYIKDSRWSGDQLIKKLKTLITQLVKELS